MICQIFCIAFKDTFSLHIPFIQTFFLPTRNCIKVRTAVNFSHQRVNGSAGGEGGEGWERAHR